MIRRVPKLLALAAAGALALAPAASRAADPPPERSLRLAVVPFYSPEKIWTLYQPLVAYLNGATPQRWELAVGDKHHELIAKLCSGEIDVALLGPSPFARAAERCAVAPLAVSLGADGAPVYRAVIVTADPALRSLADLRGRRVGLFEMSAVSHHAALAMLAAAGLSPADIAPVWLAGQDRIAAAVLAGEVAAGALKESTYEALKGDGLRALGVSEPLPSFVFAAGPGLPRAVRESFSAALLRLAPRTDPADRAAVAAWDPELANGFAPAPPSYGEDARRFLKAVEPLLRR